MLVDITSQLIMIAFNALNMFSRKGSFLYLIPPLNVLSRKFVMGISPSLKRSAGASTFNMFDTEINRLVWVDLEMTGLDVDRDRIMEVACVITDSELNVVAQHPEIIINQPSNILEQMNEWCIKQHGATGLTEACRNSTVSLELAESMVLDFIQKHVAEKCSPLAGNSVYMDRLFLQKYMPRIHDYLHYRIIDVSTIKELCRRWRPDIYKQAPPKEYNHRSLTDILESIEELKYYKSSFFKLS